MLQTNQRNLTSHRPQELESGPLPGNRGIDSMTLATLNFGLFRSLYSMGTSREKICSAMLLSADEFDYIVGLMQVQRLRTVRAENDSAAD